MDRNGDNLGFDGFDGAGRVRTQTDIKKEGIRQSKLWIAIAVIIGVCLFLTAYLNVQDNLLRLNGTSVTVPRNSHDSVVSLKDERGITYRISLDDFFKNIPSDSVTLYYYGNDLRNAKALYDFRFWIFMYCLWGPLFFICIRSIYKNMHEKNQHAILKDGKSKFDE